MILIVWGSFLAFILGMVALDLGVFHRRAHVVKLPEALTWTFVWIALALAFNVLVYYLYAENWLGWDVDSLPLSGRDAALQFLAGYVVEKSLSVDNIFVIAMIFAYFQVPLQLQHRVLFWGVLGAIVLRGVMIGLGSALVTRFDWVYFVFGTVLILSAARLMIIRHDTIRPERNLILRLAKKLYPLTDDFVGSHFVVRRDSQLVLTPLALTLLLVESSDVMFAVDSIPAIFAVTSDPFIVFTSNIFAILGLRSLYFALASLMHRFRYLKMSLVFVLAFIGTKMVVAHYYHIPVEVSLALIGGLLAVGLLCSILVTEDTARLISPLLDELEELLSISYRQARRLVVALIGFTLLIIGLAMVVLPGPAFLVVPLSLALLGVEFAWARRWLASFRQTAQRVTGRKPQPNPRGPS
ncbi:MAG: TerC/Alx family metal homeostasis membrane protein [Gemmatimonadota bacterium]|nr:MAG: TerC/Alx family metal homeostasis membrane protein [Gemmatimonadota bacterium]